jgi:uncharacterized protein involved in tellurium resistance
MDRACGSGSAKELVLIERTVLLAFMYDGTSRWQAKTGRICLRVCRIKCERYKY